MSKKIVISGWYGPGNIGDEAILQAMIDIFEEQFPKCEITALSFNPAYTKNTQKINAVKQIPTTLRSWIRPIITLDLFKTIKTIKDCDLFVMGGGGFLSDWQPEVPHDWLKQMKIAKFFGKETWLYGIGAGPFLSEKGKSTTKYYIDNYVDRIVVRDSESYRQLKEVVGISLPVEIEIDPVANLKCDKYIGNMVLESNNFVVLIFKKHYDPKYWTKVPSDSMDKLMEAYLSVIESVYENNFEPIIMNFLPTYDTDILPPMLSKFPNIIVSEPKDYKEAISIMSKSKAVISMRLHGNILAYALKKPFLPIIYHHKTDGFLKLASYPYPDCILEIGDDENWPYKKFDLNEWSLKVNNFLTIIKDLPND